MFTEQDRAALRALVEDRVPNGGVQVYERVNYPPQEFMVVAPTEYGPLASDPMQDGYRVTTDGTEARVWARQYSGADKVPVHRAKPGRSGSRRAVQITGPATPGGAR